MVGTGRGPARWGTGWVGWRMEGGGDGEGG